MAGHFWESGRNSDDPWLYRELLLTDCEKTLSRVVYCRYDYQAVVTLRIPNPPPETEAACERDVDARRLLIATGTSGRESEPHRYDRIIIVQNRPSDDIEELVRFLEK